MLLRNKYINKKAFSLIELSIVILIIGILVAGVTQASRLVSQMRLVSIRNITQTSPVNTINDLVLWLDATTESSFIDTEREDGQKLSEWSDMNIKRTTKIKLVQSDVNRRPLYITNAINGLPAVKFDEVGLAPGAGVRLFVYPSAVSGDFIPLNQATVFIILYIDGLSYVNTFQWTPASGSRFLTHTVYPDNNIYFDVGGTCCDATTRIAVSVNPANYVKVPKIITYSKSSTTLSVRTNGVAIASTTGATSSIPPGQTADFLLGNSLAGKIGEFIYFNRTLKNDEIQDIENYLQKKWSIK